jgi:hypothetical protein
MSQDESWPLPACVRDFAALLAAIGPARQRGHLSGEIPTALGKVAAELWAKDPDIRTVDVIAVK